MTALLDLTPNQRIVASAMSEETLLTNVLDCMAKFRWLSLHIRPARTQTGWRTAVQGDGKGFPDVLGLRGGFMVVAELKSLAGHLRFEQKEWMSEFREVSLSSACISTYIWTPADWVSGAIARVLG